MGEFGVAMLLREGAWRRYIIKNNLSRKMSVEVLSERTEVVGHAMEGGHT